MLQSSESEQDGVPAFKEVDENEGGEDVDGIDFIEALSDKDENE